MLDYPQNTAGLNIMDAEHINAIGTTLTDLSARTEDLRRYL